MAELPEWQPLNGVAPPVPEGGGAGRVVVLVASERAVADGWAAPAAVSLARSWSQQGRRVILVDGGLQRPSLHTAAGVSNGEGLSDAVLYGASVQRVSQPLDEGNLFLITAGTAVADSHTVARSPRWHRLSAGMTEAGVTLALFVQDGESGTAAFLGSASDIVVLANAGEPAPVAIRDLEPLVRAVTGPGPGGVIASAPDAGTTPAGEPSGDSGGARRTTLFVVLAVVIAAILSVVFKVILGAAGVPEASNGATALVDPIGGLRSALGTG